MHVRAAAAVSGLRERGRGRRRERGRGRGCRRDRSLLLVYLDRGAFLAGRGTPRLRTASMRAERAWAPGSALGRPGCVGLRSSRLTKVTHLCWRVASGGSCVRLVSLMLTKVTHLGSSACTAPHASGAPPAITDSARGAGARRPCEFARTQPAIAGVTCRGCVGLVSFRLTKPTHCAGRRSNRTCCVDRVRVRLTKSTHPHTDLAEYGEAARRPRRCSCSGGRRSGVKDPAIADARKRSRHRLFKMPLTNASAQPVLRARNKQPEDLASMRPPRNP